MFSGDKCPESDRIAEVGLLWAFIQLAIDVGVHGCSWERSKPGKSLADLASVAIISLARLVELSREVTTLGRKILT